MKRIHSIMKRHDLNEQKTGMKVFTSPKCFCVAEGAQYIASMHNIELFAFYIKGEWVLCVENLHNWQIDFWF